MGLVVYPRQLRDPRPESLVVENGPGQVSAPSGAGKPDRMLVGLLAGLTLFYLLGKTIGLGRGPTED